MTKRDPKAFVTNETLDKTLGEAVETILTGMDDMFDRQKKDLNKRFDGVNTRLDKVDGRLDKVEADVSYIKDDIKGLTADLSGITSKKNLVN